MIRLPFGSLNHRGLAKRNAPDPPGSVRRLRAEADTNQPIISLESVENGRAQLICIKLRACATGFANFRWRLIRKLLGSPTHEFPHGAEANGRFSVVEHPMSPRALAAPLHRHSREDEYSLVIEGQVGALLGDEVVIGGQNSLIFKPRNQWHTFWNAGDTPARP